MDLTNLTAKVKVFQRRTTQKVLQQMGIAEKTEDDSHIFYYSFILHPLSSSFIATSSFTYIIQIDHSINNNNKRISSDPSLHHAITSQKEH